MALAASYPFAALSALSLTVTVFVAANTDEHTTVAIAKPKVIRWCIESLLFPMCVFPE